MTDRPRVIGLTGTNGSGKGEAAAFFASRGFDRFSLSDIIRDELGRLGMPATRDNLILTGNRLREEGGPEVLARLALRRVTGPTVIDSIRNPSEIEYLREHTRFTLLAVDAPLEVRFSRTRLRGRDESAATLEEFRAKEAEELTGSEQSQQLRACMAMSDHLILNDGALEQFHRRLEAFL